MSDREKRAHTERQRDSDERVKLRKPGASLDPGPITVTARRLVGRYETREVFGAQLRALAFDAAELVLGVGVLPDMFGPAELTSAELGEIRRWATLSHLRENDCGNAVPAPPECLLALLPESHYLHGWGALDGEPVEIGSSEPAPEVDPQQLFADLGSYDDSASMVITVGLLRALLAEQADATAIEQAGELAELRERVQVLTEHRDALLLDTDAAKQEQP